MLAAITTVVLGACAPAATPVAPISAPTSAPTEAQTATASHGGHSATDPNAPFDAQFIDAMIVHHEGAIVMAKDARVQAQRAEIKTLAEAIISAQDAEIKQMKTWRAGWFAELKDTGGMAMDMGPMAVPAGDAPYDIRFIDAMIPHHEGAIAMAKEALAKSERAEIKALAQTIITAQTAEIAQMKQWREAWAKSALHHFPPTART